MSEPAQDQAIISLRTKLEAQPNQASAPSWLAKLMMAGSEFPGFLSAEISPPDTEDHYQWTLAQRFRGESMHAWRESTKRQQILEEIGKEINGTKPSEEIVAEPELHGNVATAIITQVKPGAEDAYLACETKLQVAQSKHPGYRGCYVQPPTPGTSGQWTTVLRFDTPEHLDKWFASEERAKLLPEANQIAESIKYQAITNSFMGMFPVDSKGKGPPNWKAAILVLLGLYPIVTLEIKYLSPHLSHLNVALSNFIGNIISVAATTWITIPGFIAIFTWWLFPKKEDLISTNIKGAALLAVVFAVQIALLWLLFI